MSSQLIEDYRENAEIYYGQWPCKQKTIKLLEEISMPSGLLPLDDLIEAGHNRSAGFVWVKQTKPKNHCFSSINKMVWYDTVVTAFVEKHYMRKVTGVKAKEFLIWLNFSDISISDPSSKKITFSGLSGLYRTFPFSAFEIEDDKGHLQINN